VKRRRSGDLEPTVRIYSSGGVGSVAQRTPLKGWRTSEASNLLGTCVNEGMPREEGQRNKRRDSLVNNTCTLTFRSDPGTENTDLRHLMLNMRPSGAPR
jgi:hypothetical protein